MCGHRSRKPGPPHTLCPVMSVLLTANLCQTNFYGVVTPYPLEGPLHWVELPAPPHTAQPERAEHLLLILPLSICPSPHEARGVLRGRAGDLPALGPQN